MIKLTRIGDNPDVYTHTELFDTTAAWDRVLSLMCDDIINLQDEELSSKVYHIISDLETSSKQNVIELMKDDHIVSIFTIEF
jgi:hypothetical protein